MEVLVLAADVAAQTKGPQIVRWEIGATVTDIADPKGIFSNVRLGDAVRGTLTYDVNSFTYPVWLGLASMTIENPRSGEDLQFAKDVDGVWADVFQYNAPADPSEDDDLEIYQSVVPPAGFQGEAPIVTAFFRGPSSVLSEGQNPLADLNLDDWPIALLSFYDLYDLDYTTYIDAEIGSMTPIESPLAAGDFDYDGDVDANDLHGWKDTFGSTNVLYADGDADGDVDGADFLNWQRGLGAFAATQASPNAAPEPNTNLLSTFVVSAMAVRRRRRNFSSGSADHCCN